MCSYSECYSMYTSHNATECTDENHCQLMRCPNMMYNVSCSDTCEQSCNGTSQINCSVNCCNSTGCLNETFASMMMTSTMAMTTTSTSQSSSSTTSTTAFKGNKCQMGTCNGDTCYTTFKASTSETCSSSQPYCQLKKTIAGSTVSWTAGCADCAKETVCKATTVPPCVLECCNATMTSCLVLDGTTNVNVNSFATRGPHLHTELIVSLLCLLSITLLL
ncbi:uncharacterized skeletal organic matrix protein 2 [Nematolebias whitei]|uniref:uncharacterized skeletal organic matrix protein 2 n=1 Tax=Nematolebias whitei TaxID=451745 RepID=UPI00189AFCE8|nr:uncharacterized skeletal organic matrix protein 2 [Nematolebias whitei]